MASTVATDDDRAGTREDEEARAHSQGTKQRRLGIGEHVDPTGERGEPTSERAPLAQRPDPPRRDDQGADVAARPSAS